MSRRPIIKKRKQGKPLVLAGQVLAPVGVEGGVRVEVLSDVPRRFAPGAVVYADGSPLYVQSSHPLAKGLTINFRGVDTRNAAEALRGKPLYVRESDIPRPPEDTYYYYQVLGMQVVTVEGDNLGTVTEILVTGANDVYVVSGETKQTLVPALGDVVVAMDVRGKRMTVSLPDGL